MQVQFSEMDQSRGRMRPFRGRSRGNRGFSRGGPRAPKHFQNNDRVQVWGDNTHLEPDYNYMVGVRLMANFTR